MTTTYNIAQYRRDKTIALLQYSQEKENATLCKTSKHKCYVRKEKGTDIKACSRHLD